MSRSWPSSSHRHQMKRITAKSKQKALQYDAYRPFLFIQGSLCWGISVRETLPDRDPSRQSCPWTETPWTETPWTETPLDSNPQIRDPLDRDPLDRYPPRQRPPSICALLFLKLHPIANKKDPLHEKAFDTSLL